MTGIVDAREAIYQEFLTAWGATSPFTFENEAYTPTAGVSWVRLSVRHNTSLQDSIGGVGNRKFERSGRVFIQIFTPLDRGLRPADALTATARAIFEGVRVSGIVFYSPVIREIGPDGAWLQVNVECPFDYQEVK